MKVNDLFEAQSQKAWKEQVRKKHGSDVVFWNDSVHNRAIAKKDGKIVGQMDLKTGSMTVFEAWVIKNKDGKEKRFKNANSPEALTWKNSSSPKKEKKTLEKYSDAWWDEKNWTGDYEGVMPDKKITDLDLSAGKLAAALKGEMTSEINDYHVMSGGTMKIGNTTVATARVRVTYEFDMKDMGYDDETIANSGNEDGRGLESVYVKVRRDPKKPENIVFVGYSG